MRSFIGISLMERLWRKPVPLIFAVTLYMFYATWIYSQKFSYDAFPTLCKNVSCQQALSGALEFVMSMEEKEMDPNYVVNSPGCKIMEMNPFDESVKNFIKKGKQKKCAQRIAKLDKQKLTIDEKIMKSWKKKKRKCCYRAIYRVQQQPDKYNKNADWEIKYGNTCHPISTDKGNNGIIVNDSFIKVECEGSGKIKMAVEFEGIALPPKLNSETTSNKAEYWDKRGKQDVSNPPSILIVGIDSASRLHMIRSLPKTREYLLQNDFIEMKGYTKVGENTFPNIMAGLGGMELDNYTSCWPNKSVKLDDCPYIWKNYGDLNYITAFLEDSPGIAIFNRQKLGFVLPPADYYMRPLTVAAHKYNGWYNSGAQAACIGGVSPTHFQTNFIKDFIPNMGKTYPYFLFSWFTSLGHDDFNGLKTFDDVFYNVFSVAMNQSNANPDNTIIIFMSDHGYRFGEFRETFLGFYEDSLPFFFLRLPPTLKARYPEWYSNLKRNSRQLVSPLDLHSTLTHILYDAKSKIEYTSLNSLTNSESASPKFRARYSFFEYIPGNRSCESSSIPQRYCMCGVTPVLSQFSTISSHLGDTVISNINDLLKSVISSGKCVKLKFTKFLYSREVGHGDIWNNFNQFINYTDYVVALEAGPSKAHFESKIRILQDSTAQILGDITRINSYKGQSDCVSDFNLKPYCFCKKDKKRGHHTSTKKRSSSTKKIYKTTTLSYQQT